MKNIFTIICCCIAMGLSAQDAKVIQGTLPKGKLIKFADQSVQDWNVDLQNVREAPKHVEELADKKAILERMRQMKRSNTQKQKSDQGRGAMPPMPVIADSFAGNPTQPSAPPDNTMAISNAGVIVSCVNTQIEILDSNGNRLSSSSLTSFANQLGIYNAISDPRVLYDPEQDKFVVLFFSGSASYNSKIIVAFSETNDPTTYWSFYALNGNLLNDTTWSDYPVVSLTHDDLFITFNHLKDNSDFRTGFKYSVIWQLDKMRGYNADSMQYNYWHNIVYQGKPIWNICTVQGGLTLSGPDAFFLSVRPADLNNDTVFLHEISNSYVSGAAQFSTKVLVTTTPYGLPPNAPQIDGQHLSTNDARILSAMIENDRIQYVQNCVYPSNGGAGVYVGTITNASTAPVATGQILGFDTIDLGYPSIAYIGNGQNDNRALVTCSYLPANGYPGTGAFYLDNGGTASDMLRIKEGSSAVDMLTDSLERWGDYTTIQKRYNIPNSAWLTGSYTNTAKEYVTWLAKLQNNESASLGLPAISARRPVNVFPNPSSDKFSVMFDLTEDAYCKFTLVNAQGQVVRMLLEDNVDEGTNQFSFSTAYLSAGNYYLNIMSDGKTLATKPLVILNK